MKKTKLILDILLCITAISFIACSSPSSSGGGNENSIVTYVGTKAPTEAKNVGDIVFNDGSAMSYTDFEALDTATKNTKKNICHCPDFLQGNRT